jgi:hypothetical protein
MVHSAGGLLYFFSWHCTAVRLSVSLVLSARNTFPFVLINLGAVFTGVATRASGKSESDPLLDLSNQPV